jgi:hypothetical protein
MVGESVDVHDVGGSHCFNEFPDPLDKRKGWATGSIVEFRVKNPAADLLRLG